VIDSRIPVEIDEILDSLGSGVLVLDSALCVVRASANCRQLLGIALREGADLNQASGKLAQLLPQMRTALASGRRTNTEIELDHHRYLSVGLLPTKRGAAQPEALIVTLRDITNETATETKLVAMIESTPDPFIIVEGNGRIQRVNRQAEILFGYTRDELVGQSFKILVPERFRMQHDHYTRNYQVKPVMRQMGSGLELSCLTRSGEEIPVEIGLSPVVAQDETTIMVRFHDIREQKREQALLRQALQKADEANRTKTRFLAAASHDLRQPLQSISMNLGVLAGRVGSDERKRVVGQTRMALDTTNKLLNSLLNITKLESGKVQPEIESFYIGDTLERVYNTETAQAQDKGQTFTLLPCSAAVESDPALLEQMLTNLVANAIRYTPHGGRIVLGCRRLPGHVRIEVVDNGPGIASEALGKIFDEYWQQEQTRLYKGAGLGLGLSIVKLLAELLHLKLTVSSSVGQGSRFSVEVPLAASVPAERQAPVETKTRKAKAGGTVLLIDDDEAVLDSTSLFLEVSGFRVLVAADAARALELAVKEKPDLVITDYGLAQRDTGLDLLRNIRSRLRRNVPAIVITGDTSLQRTSAMGSDVEIVCKPLDPQLLLELARKHF
jgi:PAS domain S-box-containing protein